MNDIEHLFQDTDNEIRESEASDSASVALILFSIAQATQRRELEPMDRKSFECYVRRYADHCLNKGYANASQDTPIRLEKLLEVWRRYLSSDLLILPDPPAGTVS